MVEKINNYSEDTEELTPDTTTFTNSTSDTLTEEEKERLKKQVLAEYKLCKNSQVGKLETNLARLKMYNNQRRDPDLVGDTTLFTITMTVLASLYEDQLMADFEPEEYGDISTVENLQPLAEYDHGKMEKDTLDYTWDWDTCFYGKGYVLMNHFNRNLRVPVPKVIDPNTILVDPDAESMNGDIEREGQVRFWGRHLDLTVLDIKRNKAFDDVSKFRVGVDKQSPLYKARQQRKSARNIQTQQDTNRKDFGDNEKFDTLQWWTIFNGKKCVVYLANGVSDIVRYHVVSEVEDKWPVIERSLYPIGHEFYGVSIPDLIEDKQRGRAVSINLAHKQLRYQLYPSYLYDKLKIKNVNNLRNLGSNKFIGVKGKPNGLVAPVEKGDSIDKGLLSYILESLDNAAKRATATPEIQQGMLSSSKRTLGELNLVSAGVDNRYSLSAKLFGSSEKRFWQQWYYIYKRDFKDKIDEKIIRINGASGYSFRSLNKDTIVARVDPDVKVVSKVISEATKKKRQSYGMAILSVVGQYKGTNLRYLMKSTARDFDYKEDEIDRIIPPTADEYIAEGENKLLSEGKDVYVNANDDHQIHIQINSKANETPEKKAHIEAHKKALSIKRDRPDLFRPTDSEKAQNNSNVNTNIGVSLNNSGGGQQLQQTQQPQSR